MILTIFLNQQYNSLKQLTVNNLTEGDDMSLTLSEEDFNEYETMGYFEGIEYRWTFQSGTYTLYMSQEYYQQVIKSIQSYGMLNFLIINILSYQMWYC